VRNLATNCVNLKRSGEQSAVQCRQDQQMLAELHDKHLLLRQEKCEHLCVCFTYVSYHSSILCFAVYGLQAAMHPHNLFVDSGAM